MTQLEIAVTAPRGARAALAGGADRVELCAGLEMGGLSPSAALIEQTVLVGLPVHVLIRARPGDFVYDDDDLALMEREIIFALSNGADGVVIGALTSAGDVDTSALTRLIGAARQVAPASTVTAHRALDQARDYLGAVSVVAALGVDRILTSGGEDSAGDALVNLAAVRQLCPSVQLMAGGGVTLAQVPAIRQVGVDAVHASAKKPVAPAWRSHARLGVDADPNANVSHYDTDEEMVRSLRVALTDASSVPG